MPVAVCSWYLSTSMCRLVLKKSSLAMSLWYMDTISFFCLDSEELCLSRLMLKNKQGRHEDEQRVNAVHGSWRRRAGVSVHSLRASYMAAFCPCCSRCQSSFRVRMVCHAWPQVLLSGL